MQTTVLTLADTPDWIEKALTVLRRGDLVAAPTETVYGLAGDATSEAAVAAIYAAKGRPSHNPLIAHVADRAMAAQFAKVSPDAAQVMDQFWPGPLTLVLPLRANSTLAPAVTAGGASLALRCPQGALGALSAGLQRPLAAPSANRSGHVSPTMARHVLDDLDGRIAMLIDGGETQDGMESTILDMRSSPPVLLRPGAIPKEALEDWLGVTLTTSTQDPTQPVSPGHLASHYAPRVPVRLDVPPEALQEGEAYLGFGRHALAGHATLSSGGDVREAARQFYRLLRTLDAQAPRGIAVAPIPREGLGLAINDRLRRAAAPRS